MNIFDNNLNLTVSCASGVESVLKKELSRLNYGEVPADNGNFTFSGKAEDIPKLNINLRTADRVYVNVKSFTATTFDQLFDNVKEIAWEHILPKDANIVVDGKCVKSQLFSISDCQRIIKKAIITRLFDKYRISRLEESGATYEIDFSLFKDTVTVLLNTSGAGLHKRGYRDLVGIAPIKETLASALLLMSDFYYKRPFVDPFCGSGTFVLEGARIALNIGNTKRQFAFNEWKNFDDRLYKRALEESLDNEKRDIKIDFRGFDIDPKAIKLCNHHAENLGLKEKLKFSVCDVKNLKLDREYGTICTNPPYGERVYDKEEAEACYKNLGKVLKENSGWSLFLITGHKAFERYFGKKSDRNRKMYNSNKECRYYYYYGKKI